MSACGPGFFEVRPESEEWRNEREQFVARLAAATSFSRKYVGVYEHLQESFNLWRSIEANMLRLDTIGPRHFDTAAALERSRAFVDDIELEMRGIEAMSATLEPIDLPPSPAVVAARRSSARAQRMAALEAVVKATLAPSAQGPADDDAADSPELYTGQYL